MLRCGDCLKVIQPWALEKRAGKAYCPEKSCRARLCRVCGCTERHACRGGCAWQDFDPSVCSSHEAEMPAAA